MDNADYTIRVGREAFTYYSGFPPTLQGASDGADVGPGSTIMFTLYDRTDTVTIDLDPNAFDPSSLELSESTPAGIVTVTQTEGADYWFNCNQAEGRLPKPTPGTMGGSIDVILKG